MDYIIQILIYIGIYTILSISLNLLVGFTGILSICHAAFFGSGAYIVALFALKVDTPFLINLLIAVLGTAVLGAIIGYPSLRIKDDYFIIATFAFQVLFFSILNNWVSATNGPMGLPGIPSPSIFGIDFSNQFRFLLLVSFFAFLAFFISKKIVKSPYGRVLKAIREDEINAKSHGKNIARFKVTIFMVSAGLAAISGGLFSTYISFIDPQSFTIIESIFIISIVIVGGAGNVWGAFVGSIFLVSLPELLRFIGFPNSIAAYLKQILYGALLVLFLLWRPKGIIGNFSFSGKNDD